MDHVHGTLTASSALIADSSKKLDNLIVDNIDINGNAITTTNTNGDLDLTPHGTGVVNFKGNTTGGNNPGAIKILCEAGTHGITIKSPLHSAAANYTLTLPNDDGAANQALMTNGSGVLTWGGALAGTTGTFSGAVSGTTGTFTGAVAGTTGTFSAAVEGKAATFTGMTITDGVRVGVTADNEIDTVSGNLVLDSAGGTITVDDNITIASSKTIDMGANKVTGVAEPAAASDAATKAYVDAAGSATPVTLFAPISIVLLEAIVMLSSTVIVPPAESKTKFPETVSISLSAVTPTRTPSVIVIPVNVAAVPSTAAENVPVVPATTPVNVPVVPETAPEKVPVVPANAPPQVRTPLPFVINAWFAAPSSLGKVNV
jgi:hypothetical protein